MSTNEAILEHLRQVLERDHDVEPGRVTPQTPIAELGIDSLGMIELIFQLEDRLGVSVDQGLHSQAPTTIGEVVSLIARHLPQAEPAKG